MKNTQHPENRHRFTQITTDTNRGIKNQWKSVSKMVGRVKK